jgi:ABC-type branched-subunit amino acid transport system ATPase component
MRPKLLLLDEPAAGLTPAEVKNLSAKVSQLKGERMTIVVVEHHQGMVMEIADEVAVLNNGELIADNTPEAVKKDRSVIEAYLQGGRADA